MKPTTPHIYVLGEYTLNHLLHSKLAEDNLDGGGGTGGWRDGEGTGGVCGEGEGEFGRWQFGPLNRESPVLIMVNNRIISEGKKAFICT